MGGRWKTYGDYFKFVQDEWSTTDPVTQAALVTGLIEATGLKELFSGFPVTNKVVELRLIGRRHHGVH
jgi:hypothetical protein